MKQWVTMALTAPLILLFISSVFAGEADVLNVKATPSGGNWSFSVTVQHADEGWDHYADRWEVLTPDGELLATRVLAHPHVGEQPFTRGLSGVAVPGEYTPRFATINGCTTRIASNTNRNVFRFIS